jgi:hypothetical protein
MTRVAVEILHVLGCGSRQTARYRVEAVARREGVPIALTEREVRTPAEARELGFPGSPTVRVAGRDVEPGAEAREDFGLG